MFIGSSGEIRAVVWNKSSLENTGGVALSHWLQAVVSVSLQCVPFLEAEDDIPVGCKSPLVHVILVFLPPAGHAGGDALVPA